MTTPKPVIDRMLGYLVVEADNDDVDLWSVVRMAQTVQPGASVEAIRQAVLDVIDHAVSNDLVWPNWPPTTDPRYFHYHPWVGPIDELLQHICQEWDALGREPNPGEVIWFKTPAVANFHQQEAAKTDAARRATTDSRLRSPTEAES